MGTRHREEKFTTKKTWRTKQSVFWHWHMIRVQAYALWYKAWKFKKDKTRRTKQSVFCHWRKILSCDVIV
jgi:hypothetical protein